MAAKNTMTLLLREARGQTRFQEFPAHRKQRMFEIHLFVVVISVAHALLEELEAGNFKWGFIDLKSAKTRKVFGSSVRNSGDGDSVDGC